MRKEGEEPITLKYEGEETVINENGYITTLTDVVPDLEI